MAHDYGDLVHLPIGPQHFYLLNHPEHIRDVLVTRQRNFVKAPKFLRGNGRQGSPRTTLLRLLLGEGLLTSNGDVHRHHRRLVQPAFHPHNLAAYGAVMTEAAVRAQGRWRDGEVLDIEGEMQRLTLTIVGKTLFGADLESEAEELSQAFAVILSLHDRITMPVAAWLQKLPLPPVRRFQKALGRLHATFSRLVAERRAGTLDRHDLLSLLLARDTAGDAAGLSDAQVQDHLRTFFLTGYFTTASALTWAWYLLAQHPEAEGKLHAELDAVLGGRLPTADDLKDLPYTQMVFAEAIRLYPPVWLIPRWTLAEYEVGGYLIPADAAILISPYVIQHDPRYFPEPFRFDPQRWLPEAKGQRPPFAYCPFGGGPRQCIGEGFAWTEGMLLIATLVQPWRLRLFPGHPVEVQARRATALQPRYGMRMIVERRTSASLPTGNG